MSLPITIEPQPQQLGHSTNLVGLSTNLLGSAMFNDDPRELHISGVREMNRSMFEMLGFSESLADAGDAFYKYMVAMFGIDPEQYEHVGKTGREDAAETARGNARRYRSSFLRLLKGWGYDSNGPEGAVLKGWVESRFGLFPTYHKEMITRFSTAGWVAYVEQKMSSRFHNNSIYCQLDMLYEFCQWALPRYAAPGRRHLTLYRGINAFDEHQMVERIDKKTVIMRLNNLASFSSDRGVADCFGDTILTVEVPVVKIVFFNTLLPVHPLKGEGEYLVVGGDYRVRADYL
ncbi:MAG: NAD(+)--dinitrogen-reductase ADP-D-ribosyltransferase [Magnetospirillum sp.]|nr:MAG: NAD(+)--dinitrogen-reductase ADP-D-ribosyltransferase [Magnetospirillum sp.]